MMINQYEPDIREEDIKGVLNYLNSGGFITEFKLTRELENRIAKLCGSKEAVIFPNGTLSLYAILKCLNIGRGSKVIVPNYTMAATAFSVIETGAEVLFCDIELPSCCICLKSITEIINKEKDSIDAIMFMSANGRYPSYEMVSLKRLCNKYSIKVIEDSAQSLYSYFPNGNHIGTFGIAGSFSFSMPKIVTAGQGGAVISNDDLLLAKLKSYRDFGRLSSGNDMHKSIGLNMKYTDLQASILIPQIERLEKISEIKKKNFLKIRNNIRSKYLKINENDLNWTTPWFYEVITPFRDQLIEFLKDKKVATRVMYPELNTQEAFSSHHQHKFTFINSNKISNQGLWIPSHPKLKEDEVEFIINSLNQFVPENEN